MYLPNNLRGSKLLLYFHGIGEDVGRIIREPSLFRKNLGFSVLCVEYPGYGINFYKGICTEQQMIKDSYSVLDYILATTNLKMKDIAVFGRSIGTGVSINLAYTMRNNPFYCVILKSPYYSIKDAFRSHAGCFGRMLVTD